VPVHQNLVLRTRESARALGIGQLDMRLCAACGLAYNATFNELLLQYSPQYDNSQAHSEMFQTYLDERVEHLVRHQQLQGRQIVEIGCGKGGFLRQLVANPAWNNRGTGYDPSYVGPENDCDGRLQFARTFWNQQTAQTGPAADVVLCRHVIEHIAEPGAMVALVAQALAAGGPRPVRVYFETPCLEWILRHRVVWDFFYEHCSLFSAGGLARLFAGNGLDVTAVDTVFGGQYLWLEATWSGKPAGSISSTIASDQHLPQLAHDFAQYESQQLAQWQMLLAEVAKLGQVCLWGAGAKGVTFANLVDADCQQLHGVVDVNPAKQGGFIAGSGHPIIAPAALANSDVRTVLVLNPNYTREIAATLAQVAPQCRVVDLSAEASQRMAA
jgi:SAM-dependent methyltransferase